MAHDFSARKVASANGSMTAAIFNGLFSDVKAAIEAIYVKLRGLDSTVSSVWSNDDTVTTGEDCPATLWNNKIGSINACMLDLKDHMTDSDKILQVGSDPMDNYDNKSAGALVENSEWNTMIDDIEDYLDIIDSDISAQLPAEAPAVSTWQFGDAMPMKLS
jgi:hypothetical protein